MNRRTFLKIAGMGSISFAVGCNPPPKNLFSQVEAPDDMVTGGATWYASTCRECPAGCGILAKNREARIVKIEGNPLHPVNKGKLCMRGQAALQAVYNPDRLHTPMLKKEGRWQPLAFAEAEALLKAKAAAAAQKGPDRVRLLTESVGESLLGLCTTALERLNSPPQLVYEPFAYEALKTANLKAFGVDGLASYRLDQADLLVSFGADFLETWLSPVEYAWKFDAMHGLRGAAKNPFFQISPCQTLTGANADHWLACRPGSESAIALGLLRHLLDAGKGRSLPAPLKAFLNSTVAPYTQEAVLERSGMAPALYETLGRRLTEARRPLVLGTGTGAADRNGVQTNLAVNLLNFLLDPDLALIDFTNRHRVESAARRADVVEFFRALPEGGVDLLLLHNVNPVFTLAPGSGARQALQEKAFFVVYLGHFMDETAEMADLFLPLPMPLESWDEYGGKQRLVSTLQPAMGRLTTAAGLGDLLLRIGFQGPPPADSYKGYVVARLAERWGIGNEIQWLETLQRGGKFAPPEPSGQNRKAPQPDRLADLLTEPAAPPAAGISFAAVPSIRFFDGRGANRPWLCEIPDPLSRVAWQTPVYLNPETALAGGLAQGDVVTLQSGPGEAEASVYESELVSPGVAVMAIGQGHTAYGRYAKHTGVNPLQLLSAEVDPLCGGASFAVSPVTLKPTGRRQQLASTSGSRTQHGRTFALTVGLGALQHPGEHKKTGLTMGHFPLTLPLPEGYDPKRDFYPPHSHEDYRWGMVVDLDKCVGCGACAAACYAENNIGVVGVERVLEGREMGWMSVERYHAEADRRRVTFLPMMCQHCDNAPCESVCPVYAPHHSREGLNNQIYNRCIGTRFCVQNCPYKVRRFNWFDWKWPDPMYLQLNPDVTVRSKGVMEKCSFCIQRIKAARNVARNEKRLIRDGEVTPACAQTCPTGALVFGNLMDRGSRVRQLTDDPRAYQVLGYLNTKPAVIYLKRVVLES
jgi:molybdopterin-containing oxidoreductase family iron-sulfur binding subunit